MTAPTLTLDAYYRLPPPTRDRLDRWMVNNGIALSMTRALRFSDGTTGAEQFNPNDPIYSNGPVRWRWVTYTTPTPPPAEFLAEWQAMQETA